MIHYDIDTTEGGYQNFRGNVETIDELKELLFKDNQFPDCVGYIDGEGLGICISADKESGVYLGITHPSGDYLSLHDSNLFSEWVDVWGDGLYISKGLFIPPELAWIGMKELFTDGIVSAKICWISPEDIPEDGQFIQ